MTNIVGLAQPEPFRPETWPVDADGDAPQFCNVCGTPVRYGERHVKCAPPCTQPTADGPTREDGLPNPVHLRRQQRKDGGYDMVPAYTTDEMRAFRAEGVAQERERCARVCEEVEDSAWALWKTTADPNEQGRSIGAQHCADAIRKG